MFQALAAGSTFDHDPAARPSTPDHPMTHPSPTARSAELFEAATRVLPGGNTRSTLFFAPHPLYAASAEGARVTDVDGVTRLDFVNNYSALIHGHGHPAIVEAATRQIAAMMAVGMPTQAEIDLAARIVGRVESVDRVRFTNSGSEAVMMAVQAARAFTGRSRIAKVEGAYHGAYDLVELSQISRPDAWGDDDAPVTTAMHAGQPQSLLDEVVTLPWQDIAGARRALEAAGETLAAVLIDPIPSRLSFAEAPESYLQMVREVCDATGALFILDEVYCFRLAHGGAQSIYGVRPDLTAFAKIIGGGFPVGAVGGRADVMAVFDPQTKGPAISHGGTYNGNPVTMAAGGVALDLLGEAAFARLDALGERLRSGLRRVARTVNLPVHVQGRGSLASWVIAEAPVLDYRSLVRRDGARMARLHRELLERGVMTTPAGAWMLSTAMTEADVDQAIEAAGQALAAVADAGA
jgi:glutamate-1-semialdehyde 2,1-aminomutase